MSVIELLQGTRVSWLHLSPMSMGTVAHSRPDSMGGAWDPGTAR